MPETIPFLEYLNLDDAMKACVEGTTQSQAHIKPLHRHFAMRLVIEGGFRPTEITPSPPFTCDTRKKENVLLWNEAMGSKSERTVIGGVKTKQIDIVVTKPSLGPVMALSFKGTQNAFRNLTNRMEEAVGIVRTFTFDILRSSMASITLSSPVAVRKSGYTALSAERTM